MYQKFFKLARKLYASPYSKVPPPKGALWYREISKALSFHKKGTRVENFGFWGKGDFAVVSYRTSGACNISTCMTGRPRMHYVFPVQGNSYWLIRTYAQFRSGTKMYGYTGVSCEEFLPKQKLGFKKYATDSKLTPPSTRICGACAFLGHVPISRMWKRESFMLWQALVWRIWKRTFFTLFMPCVKKTQIVYLGHVLHPPPHRHAFVGYS